MFCESKSTVLQDLKEKGILGANNDILNPIEFEKFNKEFTRFIELKYNLNTEGELAFSTYDTQTRYPYTSRYYRDDIQTTVYVQTNDPLFEALDDARMSADVKEAMNDYEILDEPDATFPEDESLNPMFMRDDFQSSSLNRQFSNKMRQAMLSFMEGLNIKVEDNLEEIIPSARRTWVDDNGVVRTKEDPLAAYDVLQKYLALKTDVSDKDLARQTAFIMYSFLGKKSKLGIELWKGISNWSKYQQTYDKHNKRRVRVEEDVTNMTTPYGEQSIAEDKIKEAYEFDPTRFNAYAHKQTIIDFIADMIVVGIDNGYAGNKKSNPDLSKDYFESLGYKDKYAENWLTRQFNAIWNWIQEHILGNKAITIYKEAELRDTVMDIVDDMYKKNYSKFIRSYYQDGATGKFFSNKGEEFEQKYYQKSLSRDPFAKEIVEKLFNAPYEYYLSGSLVLRKYGRVVRALSEDLHDIDGVISLAQFTSEKNAPQFLKWIEERGLPLSKDRSRKNSKQFVKEMMPYLEGQSWYQDVKKEFPSWTFENAFIGRDHKKGESITISGYVEHPTEMELDETTGEERPKRYVLDFFLRTQEGNYPEIFDQYFKDWKQIFEAKVNMGRGKDLTDLIYFQPFVEDQYKFTNRGFRYFSFADDSVTNMPDANDVVIDETTVKNQRAAEAANALGQKIAAALNVDFQNITEEEAKSILQSRKKLYAGEPAFFFGGTVYIVGDNVSFDTVLHELSHPLLRAIQKENPELFNNLYNKLLSTTEGQLIRDHVLANYPELKESDPLFQEEVLAYALQRHAANKVTEQVETSGFESFINSMMAALKDLLRRIFGSKTVVSDIDVDTTIDELADKLLGEEFEYETEFVSNGDVVAWARNIKDMAQTLTKDVKAERIQDAINEMYTTNQLIYEKASNFKTRSPQYQQQLKEALFLKGTTELLPRIKRTLQGFQTIGNTQAYTIDDAIKNTVEAERRRMEDITNRARSFVNTVAVVNNISKNIYQDLDMMQKSKSFGNRDAVALLFLYRSSVRSYNQMFDTFDELVMAEENNFDINQQNDLMDLVNETRNNLTRADKKIREIYQQNSVDFYVEITGYMNDFLKEELGKNLKNALTDKLTANEIEDFYKKVITQELNPNDYAEFYKMLADKGIEDKYIKKFVDEYNKFLINQDKITDGLSGKLRDVSWFNRMFESYTSSNDPIVGGISIFINDQRTEAANNALEKSYKFRQKLEQVLPKIGFNTLNTRQVLDMVMFKDKIMVVDPKTKKPVLREVYSFLNEFKDYRYEQDLLEYNLDEAFASEDEDLIKSAAQALKQFNEDYMWQENVPEFYKKDEIFDKYPAEIGKAAWLARKMALDAYNNEANEISDELERFQKYSTLQELWREYQMLYSLKYADGSPKVDDPANGIYDLSIAQVLMEHRDATRDYYEFVPRAGSLQTAFNEFLSLQESNGVKGEDLVKAKDEWIKQNTRIVYTPEFYESRKDLITRLKAIQGKINKSIGEQFDISNAYTDIFDLMFAYKDEQGQPIPSEIGPEKMRMIKDLNQKIIDYKAKFDTKTGLSKDEAEELEIYIAMSKKDPAKLNTEQKARYRSLLQKQTEGGLSLDEIATMQSIYAELSSLTQKVATDYYIDALNEHLQRMNVATVTADEVDDFINSDEIKNLLAADGKFVDWFKDNHVSKKVKNKKTRKQEVRYERSMANSVSIPKSEKYYQTTTLFNELTGKEETIKGMPNARHSVYRVKSKYRTGYNPQTGEVELKVGEHIDNKGQFLPRPFAPNNPYSAVNDKYINEEYTRLKSSNSARFEFLELLKENHLAFQDGKSNKSKLYYDMPRYVLRDNLSRLQAGKVGDRYQQVKLGVKQYLTDSFGKSVDEAELEHNYERENNMEEYRLVNTDLNSEEVSYIPVTGMYNIELDNTDPDVLRGMFKYLQSLELQSKLHETLPLVNSILDTLADPKNAPKTPNTFSRTIKRNKGKLEHTTKPGASNNRLGQVRSLIEREYYGVQFDSAGGSLYLDKFVGKLQKLSSRASLAINIPSDLKNRYGQIVQNIIESAGGEFVTAKDLAKARLWAATTMIEWASKSVYTKGVPALSSQMIEMFDAAFKFKDDFGRSVTRNVAKDMMNGEWMYNIRKNLEMEAALQLFGAFLNAEKVEQKLSNGKTITINYKDAWQINKDTGIAELKPGIDPAWSNRTVTHDYVKGETLESIADRYNVTVEELQQRNKIVNALEFEDGQEIIIARSDKFKRFRNKFQGVSHRLYGAYDDFAQSEGNKYLPYRMFTFMRKWFVPMLTNRWGASVNVEEGIWKPKFEKRYNWMTGKTNLGFYVNGFIGMKELLKSKGKYWAYMPADQKRDLIRTLSESLFIIGAALITSMIFGYDPDDKERFQKMKARSGALGTDEFKTWGFLQNHALILLLGVQGETSAFVPLPTIAGVNLGADDYIKMLSTTTSSFGNTISLYTKIMEDVLKMVTFNDKAYYSRKEGEYFWQQKDYPKIVGHLLKTVGITGSTGDTSQALENLENAGKLK